jgi:hypothetical protein
MKGILTQRYITKILLFGVILWYRYKIYDKVMIESRHKSFAFLSFDHIFHPLISFIITKPYNKYLMKLCNTIIHHVVYIGTMIIHSIQHHILILHPANIPFHINTIISWVRLGILIILLLRRVLLYITFASYHQAYIPSIEQHYTFERMNDRYIKDDMAYQKVISMTTTPPP